LVRAIANEDAGLAPKGQFVSGIGSQERIAKAPKGSKERVVRRVMKELGKGRFLLQHRGG
jgi:hypothetical protein